MFCGVTTFAGCAAVICVFWITVPVPVLAAGGFVAAAFASMTGPNMRTMLLDVNAPECRGAIFSIFNMTDSLGTGTGRWFAGILSASVGLSMALSVSVLFWLFCGAVLILTGKPFVSDMRTMHAKMEAVSRQMKENVAGTV